MALGLFQIIFGASERRSIDTDADWADLVIGGTTPAGIHVGPASAMRSTVVRACVTLISGVLTALPPELFEIAVSDERRVGKGHVIASSQSSSPLDIARNALKENYGGGGCSIASMTSAAGTASRK